MAQITNSNPHPKHDIHKFRDIIPMLSRDNWSSWKREILATARERGLYAIILGTDTIPTTPSSTASFTQLMDEWHDRNNSAYNQILLCVSPDLQTPIDDTDIAHETWNILQGKFESHNPSKISIVRTRYETYHMVEGQSVITYLTVMREYRTQLKKMGEIIADSTHAATILRNIPESWRSISQMIRMITHIPEEIEEKLEAHEADLTALEMANQAANAFIPQSRPIPRPVFYQPPISTPSPPNHQQQPQYPQNRGQRRPTFNCNNCGRAGHPASQCYSPGGGLAGQAPWRQENRQNNQNLLAPRSQTPIPIAAQSITHYSRENTDIHPKNTPEPEKLQFMVAAIKETEEKIKPSISCSMSTHTLSSVENKTYHWLADSAASSHISGNLSLFKTIYDTPPIC